MTTIELLARFRRLGIKLWAEGDRLRFQAPKGALTPELREALAERKADVLAFLSEASVATQEGLEPIQPAQLGDKVPLSFAQQRLWFLDQMEPGSPLYNIPSAVRLTGLLDMDALRRSIDAIIQRHAVLRTTFAMVDQQPIQVIGLASPTTLENVDFRSTLEAGRDAAMQQEADAEVRQPFDLARGPLMRVKLLRRDDQDYLLLVTLHHIIADGWSINVLVRELAALYAAFSTGRPVPLPELPIQYADFSVWQRQWLEGADSNGETPLQRQLTYWKRQLGDATILELPTDRLRPPLLTYNGVRYLFELPADLTAALNGLSQRAGVSLFMTLLAAFQVLLFRYSGQADISVGTPIANRTRPEIEGLIGFFVNTLVLRTDLSGNPTFKELLGRVREATVGAYAHQDVPFERLVEELRPTRDLGRNPLFQVMLVLQNAPSSVIELPDLTMMFQGVYTATSKFDLELGLTEIKGQLLGYIEYNIDLFDASTITRFVGHFQTLLEGATKNSDCRVSALPLLTEGEQHQLLVEWNESVAEYPRESCFHELFEAQAARQPNATAVICEGRQISYGELNERANQLAHHLRSLGVGPDSLVALLMERSLEVIVGIVGIHKAGGAYVPLDPAYPADRIQYMLEDSRAAVVLTATVGTGEGERGRGGEEEIRTSGPLPLSPSPSLPLSVIDLVADWPTIARQPATNPERRVLGEHLAYIIYTSGSTGRPKGVQVMQRGLLNLCYGLRAFFDDPAVVSTALITSFSFDISVNQVFPTLLFGRALHIIPDTIKYDSRSFVRYLGEHKIDLFDAVPSYLNAVLTEIAPERVANQLRYILVGGEKLERRLLAKVFEQLGQAVRIVNIYGLTEITDINSLGVIGSEDLERTVTIGLPLQNNRIYITDRSGNLQPIGVTGEVCISGESVSRGYLNRPELTAEKFVVCPFEDGALMVRTGDVGRRLPDGTIELLGRMDHQIKLRGFRIEIGEIEALLDSHPDVREVVVVVREDLPGDQRLVAYVVSGDWRLEIGDSDADNLQSPISNLPLTLRAFLKQKLPDYMVPTAFVLLDELPHTPNGKVDRKALPAPDGARPELEHAIVAPRTPIEAALVEIWSSVLGTSELGVHDNFFELGGHSLLATQLVSRVRETLQVELQLRQMFAAPTIAELAELIEARRAQADKALANVAPPLTRIERAGPQPLSFAQQRLWFLDQFESGTALYNIPSALRLTGQVDLDALRHSIDALIQRHAVLRTTFTTIDQQPVQVIAPVALATLEIIDFRSTLETERDAAMERYAVAESRQPFDLAHGPLMRVKLLRRDDDDYLLLVTMHHIITDGWSIGVLVRDLVALYAAFSAGRPAPLSALAIQYADFAVWQRQWLESPDPSGETQLQRQLAYWRRQLDDAVTALELPADRPRPPLLTYNGAKYMFELPAELNAALNRLSQRAGGSLFMTLLAAFQTLLYRYSGQTDILVGTPIANRTRHEIEDLIGFFVNTLVLRTDLSGNPTFTELLERVREVTLEAYAHQDVPFERLVEELRLERDLSRNPLFQVALTLQNTPSSAIELPGLTLNLQETDTATAKFDMEWILFESKGQLVGQIEYSTDLFDASTIARLVGNFHTLLEGVTKNPDCRVSALPLLTEGEQHQLLVEWNASGADYPRSSCFTELFEAQAARQPEAIAVVCEGRQISYGELNERANQLAHHLRSLGVGPDSLVALLMERSLEVIVGIVGIHKAGGAYVPLDPAYPADRIQYMLEDSRAAVVLTYGEIGDWRLEIDAAQQSPISNLQPPALVDLVADWETIARQPTTNPERRVLGEHLAYIIYTSGSTGRPKGVQVMQRGLLNLCYGLRAFFDDPAVVSTALITSFSFDISVNQVFPTLLFGRALHIIPDTIKYDSRSFVRYLGEHKIDLFDAVPSYLNAVLTEIAPERVANQLRYILVGGEKLERRLLAKVFEQLGQAVQIVNIYGLTEITDINSLGVIGSEDLERTVTIGLPLQNNRIYITDRSGNLQPIGVTGEVCISGESVSRGYLNRPELTAEKFVVCPFEDGALMVRTGDVGRRLPDGTIELLGRMDHQIKLRGFRIEIGEIEALLDSHPDVREVVVVVREDVPGDQRLVAYLVPGDWRLEIGDSDADNLQSPISNLPLTLRAFLKAKLPDYMVPTAFVLLDELPHTPNGKVDRKALPAPDGARPELEHAIVAPRTPIEAALVEIWSSVLGTSELGVHDNFFELGGHSLLATQVVSRIREMLQVEIPLRQMFATPTIAELAEPIGAMRPQADKALANVARSAPIKQGTLRPLSFSQERLWFLDQLEPGSPLYTMPVALRLTGKLDQAALERTLNTIVERHETLRTTFTLVAGQPTQVIAPATPIDIARVDLRDLPADAREARAQQLAIEESLKPFDLARGPLLRVKVLQLDEEDYVVLCTMHHIVSDGWSISVMTREFGLLYGAFVRSQESPLEDLPIQYADFAIWQRRWLQGEVLERQLAFWRQQLGSESSRGLAPLLNLPTDRPRPPVQTFAGRTLPFILPQTLADALIALSQHEQVTLFMTLLAAFQVLLSRYSGQDDISVGTPIANRNRREIEPLIGCFINTLVLRSDLSGAPSFRELLQRVHQTTLGAYDHQDVPFEVLVEALQPARQMSHTPLYQVMFIMLNTPSQSLDLPDARLSAIAIDTGTAKTDLTLSIVPIGNTLSGDIGYNTDLFDHATIERMLGHFMVLLEGIVASPSLPIAELPLLSAAEQQQLLVEWNDTAAPYREDVCFHAAFEAQVERTPDAVAVVFGATQLTYRTLNRRANQLAHYLGTFGVGPETLVGLCIDRSVEMIIGLLGIMKAGAAYLPLDPTYPDERIRYMLEDAGVAVLLTSKEIRDWRLEIDAAQQSPISNLQSPVIFLDADWEQIAQQPEHSPSSGVGPDNLAYVIYTSGSTGKSKGVMIEHRSVLNLAGALDRAIYAHHSGRSLRVSLNAPLSFDASVKQLVTLLSGHALYILPDDIRRDGHALVRYLRECQLDALDCVPSQLKLMLGAGLLDQGRWAPALALVGGEEIDEATWQALAQAPKTQFYNVYGPTECTVDATTINARTAPDRPTIGRPLANVKLFILDRNARVVPICVAGELHIGGAGVARGYLGRPTLTAERFVPDPFLRMEDGGWRMDDRHRPSSILHPPSSARLYRTGDLCRYRSDGTIEFLGRIDTQIKLRGFRIELGEIEAALKQHGAVRETVAVVREDMPGEQRLVAYVVPGDWRVEIGDSSADNLQSPISNLPQELRAFLKDKLPDYMIPAAFVLLEALPLTPNGKIDRKALPAPDGIRPEFDLAYLAPRTELEGLLAQIWSEHFRIERIGVYDNFFELGGNSIQAAVLINRLQEVLGEYVYVIALFEAPSVAALADYLSKHHGPALARLGLSAGGPDGLNGAEPGGVGLGDLGEIRPVPRENGAPLSFAQQRLWFLDQLEPGSPLYNIPTGVRLRGKLDVEALQRSVDAIIQRHESLRTSFAMVDGQPVQVIAPAVSLPLDVVDLRAAAPADREDMAQRLAIAEAQRPFDLERVPLARATLGLLGDDEYLLLFTLHHIITDGWSTGVLIRELAAFYTSQLNKQPAPLPELPIQYADFAVWQREWFQGHRLEQQLAYWKQQMASAPAALELPTDRPRPAVQSFRGATMPLLLPTPLSLALGALSQREGVTLFMTLLAAFQTLLFRYTGQDDILVGSPIANRTRKEIEGLIGFFVNTLVLRTDLSGNPTFRELLGRVRQTALGAFAHQDLPFEYLVEALQPERDLSRSPLFQVMLVLQNAPSGALNLPGLTLQALNADSGTAKFDLLLFVVEQPNGLAVDLEYNTDLFDASTIARLLAHFQNLLEGIVANPEGRVSALPLLTEAEQRQQLVEWNATAALYPSLAAHQLVERQAARTPDEIAVIFPSSGSGQGGDERLTYRELDARANQLAHHLRAIGVGVDMPVGISMERSLELAIGILGILKAGGAYVPLDPNYPAERLALMVENAGARVVLTASERRGEGEKRRGGEEETTAVPPLPLSPSPPLPLSTTVIDLITDWPTIAQQPVTNPDSGATLDNLAYVIYTSGSTGVPKGVAMPHRPLVNLIAWQQAAILGAARTLQFASPSFDVSFQEIFTTWASGGTLVLPPEALRRDPEALAAFLHDQRVERLFLPFVALQQLAEAIAAEGRAPAYLRDVITAGEQLQTTPAITQWFAAHPHPRLHNHYGPSETHVVTAHLLEGAPTRWPALPPIGQPIANTQSYVLDRAGQPVPLGVVGDLFFGGDNLARGYLHRPDLTAERFIPNPFAQGRLEIGDWRLSGAQSPISNLQSPISNRLYKTGDLARYRPDGNIEFLGRADAQVKIRGYRIEPGEIETVLAQHPGVHEVVVVAREDVPGTKRLVAYVVPRDWRSEIGDFEGDNLQSPISNLPQELRLFLRDRLPDYMIPAAFAVLERWPLTPSGKIDRRALPAQGETRDGSRDTLVAPRDVLELRLTRIWEELLGTQPVGIRDSFFELGGHSLLVVRLMAQVQQQIGQKLPLATLFQEPTIEHLARALRHTGAALPPTPLVALQPNGAKPPFFCVHAAAGSVLSYLELTRLLGPHQPFYGLQATGLDGEEVPQTSVEEMARVYLSALQAVQPEGPYQLGGWSFGGLVAYEMARQLTAQGHEVALLALLDSWAPTPEPLPTIDDTALLAGFVNDLSRTFGTGQTITAEALAPIAPEQRLAYALEQTQLANMLPPDIGAREIAQYLAVFKASLRAMQSYRPQPYAGRVTLFRAGDRPVDEAGPTLGWEGLPAGGVELRVVPGDHYTFVRQPHVAVLAEQLGACLDEAQTMSEVHTAD